MRLTRPSLRKRTRTSRNSGSDEIDHNLDHEHNLDLWTTSFPNNCKKMAMVFIFLLILLMMCFSEAGAFQKPPPGWALTPRDPHYEFEKTFLSENLMPPPSRLYEKLEDPFKSLDRVFDEKGVFFKKASKRAKAVAMYAAAHSLDEKESDPLTTAQWKGLLESLLSSKEYQDRLVSMIKHDPRRMPQDGSNWLPKFPFMEDSPLAAWRQQSNFNREMITTFDETDPPMQACQLGKNCYMVAAILCLAYNQKRYSVPGSSWTRISMKDIMSYAVNQQTIYNKVVNNRGTNSYNFLENLLCTGCEFDRFSINPSFGDSKRVDYIFWFLRSQGAALISGFRVGEDFFEHNKFSYDGTPQFDKCNGRRVTHAMVLVGARRDANNKVWLLVQNSWPGKQFVEMSLGYFVQCGHPDLSFGLYFPQEKMEIKQDFRPISAPHYGEYLIEDGGDDDYLPPEYEED